MVKSKISINTTTKTNEIMKIRAIIREQLLKELDMSRERGLLSNLMMKYIVMGTSFTKRHGSGEIWFTKNEIREILMKEFLSGTRGGYKGNFNTRFPFWYPQGVRGTSSFILIIHLSSPRFFYILLFLV